MTIGDYPLLFDDGRACGECGEHAAVCRCRRYCPHCGRPFEESRDPPRFGWPGVLGFVGFVVLVLGVVSWISR